MVSAVQRIDVRTGRCRVVARLPRSVGHAAAAVVRGQVLLMGGRTNSDTVTSRMEWFDPRHGSTRFAGRLPEPLADAGVVARHTGVYLLGGETPRLTARVVRVKAQ
jgi:N-acetylneuraminic acid mutarotase